MGLMIDFYDDNNRHALRVGFTMTTTIFGNLARQASAKREARP